MCHVVDRQQDDLFWASGDGEVQEKYRGQYVVPFERRIVAHGKDLAAVLDEAARVTGLPAPELSHCAVLDPLADLPK